MKQPDETLRRRTQNSRVLRFAEIDAISGRVIRVDKFLSHWRLLLSDSRGFGEPGQPRHDC